MGLSYEDIEVELKKEQNLLTVLRVLILLEIVASFTFLYFERIDLCAYITIVVFVNWRAINRTEQIIKTHKRVLVTMAKIYNKFDDIMLRYLNKLSFTAVHHQQCLRLLRLLLPKPDLNLSSPRRCLSCRARRKLLSKKQERCTMMHGKSTMLRAKRVSGRRLLSSKRRRRW